MNTAIKLINTGTEARTTSRNVADIFGKQHKDVLRKIQGLECSVEFNQRNFTPVEYRDAKGENRTEYTLTKDGFMFLAMGFTGLVAARLKEEYINEFNRLEAELQAGNPNFQSQFSTLDAIKAMVTHLEETEARVKSIELDSPLSAVQRANLDDLMHAKAKELSTYFHKPLTIRRKMMGSLKREFLESKHVSNFTWKDIPAKHYAAAVDLVNQWK